MRVNEVAEELGVSVPYAYKLIRELNEELRKTGCITIAGRIDRRFFHEKFYGTKRTERKERIEWQRLKTRKTVRGMYSSAIPTGAGTPAEIETRICNEKGCADMGASF